MNHTKIKIGNVTRGMRVGAATPIPPGPGDLQSQIDALKAQATAQQAAIDAQQAQIDAVQATANGAAIMPNLTILDAPFSNPPATADLEAIRIFVNEMGGQLQGGW